MLTIHHDNLTDSAIVREKFPNGVLEDELFLGTPTRTPRKGLYCLGFWRGLPSDVVDELKERNIDPSVRLWNRPSEEYLSQNVTDRIATDYSDDEFEDGDVAILKNGRIHLYWASLWTTKTSLESVQKVRK
jgi:uncharacterized protein YlaI